MTVRKKYLATTLALTLVLMAFHPVTPLGATLWPHDADAPQPPTWSLPLFLVLFLSEAAVSAFGVAYLLFGGASTRAMLPDRPGLARAAHVSLAFLLIQWWPHGNLHMSVPFSFGSILAIDYAFHLPIMLASLVLLAAIVHVGRRTAQASRVARADETGRAATTQAREAP